MKTSQYNRSGPKAQTDMLSPIWANFPERCVKQIVSMAALENLVAV